MNHRTHAFAALLCALCAAVLLVACGQPAQETSSTTEEQVQQKADEPTQTTTESKSDTKDDTSEGKDSRIDVSDTGADVATYQGAKYIVSDATIDQGSNDGDYGLQEICVVRQPDAWESVGSIGWTRNNITYTNVVFPWGNASFAYAYTNEAGAQSEEESWSRTTEESYFAGAEGVSHIDLDGHHVAYLRADSDQGDMGIFDMEAEENGWNPGSVVTLYTYEQRGDKCAFSCNAVFTIAEGSSADFLDEDLVKMAYEPLSFAQRDESVDAASYAADLAISNADGTKQLVIGRANDELLSYEEHKVSLLEDDDPDAIMRTTMYDFAPADTPEDDAEKLEVASHTVLATVSEVTDASETGLAMRKVDAWVDFDGSPLHVEATMGEGEDLATVMERVVTNRVSEA